jgi:hypothetical protein
VSRRRRPAGEAVGLTLLEGTFSTDVWFDEEMGAGEVLQATKTSNGCDGLTRPCDLAVDILLAGLRATMA